MYSALILVALAGWIFGSWLFQLWLEHKSRRAGAELDKHIDSVIDAAQPQPDLGPYRTPPKPTLEERVAALEAEHIDLRKFLDAEPAKCSCGASSPHEDSKLPEPTRLPSGGVKIAMALVIGMSAMGVKELVGYLVHVMS